MYLRIIVLLVVAACAGSVPLDSQSLQNLGKTSFPDRADIQIDRRLVSDALGYVAKTYHEVIGLEYAITPPYDRDQITLHMDKASVAEVLDAIVKANPHYSWRRDMDSAIHVFSTDAPGLASITLNKLEIKGQTLSEVSALLDDVPEISKWLRDNGCTRTEIELGASIYSLTPKPTIPPASDSKPVVLVSHSKTLRENLDEIVKAYGTYYWTVSRWGGDRISITIGASISHR